MYRTADQLVSSEGCHPIVSYLRIVAVLHTLAFEWILVGRCVARIAYTPVAARRVGTAVLTAALAGLAFINVYSIVSEVVLCI